MNTWKVRNLLSLILLVSLLSSTALQAGPSVFLTPPPDPDAVTVQATGDGIADDTTAIQDAIDAAEAKGEGIVYLPSGRYRISRTLFLWPSVRLFGVGETRPVLVLGENTPGFQQGVANMVIFAGRSPSVPSRRGRVAFPPPGSVPFRDDIADANPGTAFTAMSNIDIEIGDGNEAAAAIRFHAAQHAYLHHMDFNLGTAFAGIYQAGNEAVDLHFFGGRYGIVTEKPTAAWPFTLIDSSFDGQRDAAIREHETGLTLVNVSISNTPVGIEIDEGYSDWLWGSDVSFNNVSEAGVVISNENNVFTQIGFQNAQATDTPVFAKFRDSGRTVEQDAPSYQVDEFTYGLTLADATSMGEFVTNFDSRPVSSHDTNDAAIRSLPPTSEWTNVHDLGVKGDGVTDDTAALQQAISEHRVLYFPSGFYHISDTLLLQEETVLIGLHPSMTQIVLPDETPGFQGLGSPKAMIEAPPGGQNIVSGLGLFASGINARATNLLWQAGENSLVDDVKLQGGHGTQLQDGTRLNPYDATHSADPDRRKRWDGQYPSLWVTNGGGGTFTNIWTVNTYAQSGFTVSDTSTPGYVYQVSNEHHVRAEFVLDNVQNWEFLGAQTEEEVGESLDAVSFDIRDSSNILLANYHGYRVTRTKKAVPMAVRLENSTDIRFRNVHVNAESGFATCDDNGCGTFLRASKFPYENSIVDINGNVQVREREFAVLDYQGSSKLNLTPDSRVTKLAGDFHSVGGGATDAAGKLYFVDRKFQRIYGWDTEQGLSTEREAPLDPVNLAVDAAGNILVQSSLGAQSTVYSFKPGSPEAELTIIPPTAVTPHPEAATVLPGNFWNNGEFKDRYDPASDHFTTFAELFAEDVGTPMTQEYVSLDGSLVLPAFRVFQQGPPDYLGWRWSHALNTYGFVKAEPGERVFVSNESEGKVYSATVGEGGALSDLQTFTNRGGESVAVDAEGNVYVANGQIFVFDADGEQIDLIKVPERPLQIVFGGKDKRTLLILTHHSLYSAQL